MIVRSKRVVDRGLHAPVVRACVEEFLLTQPRLERLKRYYDGAHAIGDRLREPGLPNARLAHDFPRYICTLSTGYLAGNPIEYSAPETQKAALDGVLENYRLCAVDSVDVELARQASLYGRGVELVFADAQARPRTAALDPRLAFVVYDDTVENHPLFGVRLRPRLRDDGAEDGWCVEVCTEGEIIHFRSSGPGDVGPIECRQWHFFGGVPMVEYWNGEDERGDFEGVLPLIDAYDRLQSDRINDKAQFVDALLLLYGCTMETDARGRSPGQQLREDKVLALPDADARAEWLCKQLNEADTEVLRRALASDIHKLSMVPDLSDEHFAGNSSGVAMRYKLLGMEQLARVKERWFREALRQRLSLFSNFLSLRGAPPLDVNAVKMTFSRSLPVNELEQAEAINALRGLVPDEQLRARAARLDGES